MRKIILFLLIVSWFFITINVSAFSTQNCTTQIEWIIYKLEPCGIDTQMVNGEWNQNFSFTIIPSKEDASYSFSVYWYGEWFPTYGILWWASSGGARWNTQINKYFSDKSLTEPKYNWYLRILVRQNNIEKELRFNINLLNQWGVIPKDVSLGEVNIKDPQDYVFGKDSLNVSAKLITKWIARDTYIQSEVQVYDNNWKLVDSCSGDSEVYSVSGDSLTGQADFECEIENIRDVWNYTFKVMSDVNNVIDEQNTANNSKEIRVFVWKVMEVYDTDVNLTHNRQQGYIWVEVEIQFDGNFNKNTQFTAISDRHINTCRATLADLWNGLARWECKLYFQSVFQSLSRVHNISITMPVTNSVIKETESIFIEKDEVKEYISVIDSSYTITDDGIQFKVIWDASSNAAKFTKFYVSMPGISQTCSSYLDILSNGRVSMECFISYDTTKIWNKKINAELFTVNSHLNQNFFNENILVQFYAPETPVVSVTNKVDVRVVQIHIPKHYEIEKWDSFTIDSKIAVSGLKEGVYIPWIMYMYDSKGKLVNECAWAYPKTKQDTRKSGVEYIDKSCSKNDYFVNKDPNAQRYTFKVVLDENNQLIEENESNNSFNFREVIWKKNVDHSVSYLDPKIQIRANNALNKLYSRLERRYSSNDWIISYLEGIIPRLEKVANKKPKYKSLIAYMINHIDNKIIEYNNDIDNIFNIIN